MTLFNDLRNCEKTSVDCEKNLENLFIHFYDVGMYINRNKISLWDICDFVIDSEDSVQEIHEKITYYLWCFTSKLLVNQFDLSTEKYSRKIFRIRSGVEFFMELYKNRIEQTNNEIYSTWQAYEAQLDYTFIRWIVKYSFRPLEAENGINTELHWWWKLVGRNVEMDRFKIFYDENLVVENTKNQATEEIAQASSKSFDSTLKQVKSTESDEIKWITGRKQINKELKQIATGEEIVSFIGRKEAITALIKNIVSITEECPNKATDSIFIKLRPEGESFEKKFQTSLKVSEDSHLIAKAKENP